MMQYDWHILIEQIAILILLIRLFFYAKKDQRIFYSDFEIPLYIVVLFMNNLLCAFWASNSISFYFFHAAAPISVLLGITLRGLKQPLTTLIIILSLVPLHLYLRDYYLTVTLYILAIFLLLRKANVMVNRSSTEIQKSSLYIVLALDLLFSLKVFVIAKAGFGWEGSVLIEPMWWISLIIFALTIIVLHVKLRRFFIA